MTWVLAGALHHTDSAGHTASCGPVEVQVLSAGSGVTHTEVAGPDGPTRFVQAWLTPDEPDATPAYSVTPVDLAPGELTEVVPDRRRRRSGSPGSPPATPSRCPTSRSSTSSSPAARWSARRWPSRWPTATPSGSPTAPGPDAVTAAVPTELLVWSFTVSRAGRDRPRFIA